MMFKVKITFDENAFRDKVMKAAQQALVKEVKSRLSPFEDEIVEEGGEVDIQITDKLSVSVHVTGISPELKQRVEDGLNGK